MNIIDVTKDILTVYESGQFNIEKWKSYMNFALPQAKDICLQDMEDSISAGLSWEKVYLPVLNAVPHNITRLNEITQSFHKITENLTEKIYDRFGKSLDWILFFILAYAMGRDGSLQSTEKQLCCSELKKSWNWDGAT